MNRDRDRALYEQRVISKQVLDNSTGEAERAEAALAASRANAEAVKQDIGRVDAESQGLGSLRESLRLVSPADGVIVSREAEPGTTVVAGQAVLRVVVPESLWVRARVDQSRAQGLQEGQLASIALRSAPETPMPGRVARIEMQSDPVTEERVVNVSFDAPPARGHHRQPGPGGRDPVAFRSGPRRRRHRLQLRAAHARRPRSRAEG